MNYATVISLPLTTSLKRHWPRTQVDNCQVWGSSCKSPRTNGTKQPSHDNILTATRTEQPSIYGHTANRAVSKWAPFLCLITPSEATSWIKVNMYNLSKSKVCVKSFGVSFHCLSKTAISKQKWTVINISMTQNQSLAKAEIECSFLTFVWFLTLGKLENKTHSQTLTSVPEMYLDASITMEMICFDS